MPTTTLPPAKSFDGITARELLAAENSDGGPPTSVFSQTTRVLTLHAGTELVVESPGAGVVRLDEADTDVVTLNVAGQKQIRFQCPIIASTVPEGTRLGIRGMRFNGAPWSFLAGDGSTNRPWLPVHEAKTGTDGKVVPVLSDWFAVDDDFDIDNLTIEHVVYGGDGTGEFVMGDIFVELTADPRPPTSEVPEPTAPGTLWAIWDPNDLDIGGEFVPNSIVGGATRDLILGTSVSDTAWNPSIVTEAGPHDAFNMSGGIGGGFHNHCRYPSAPDFSAGATFFFYFHLVSLGTAPKFLCGVSNGVVIGGITPVGRIFISCLAFADR